MKVEELSENDVTILRESEEELYRNLVKSLALVMPSVIPYTSSGQHIA